MVMIVWIIKFIELTELIEFIWFVDAFLSTIQPINLVNSQPCVLPSNLGPIPET